MVRALNLFCVPAQVTDDQGTRVSRNALAERKIRQPQKGQAMEDGSLKFESTKKKEVGVSDLTLISKITNEAINENLKKRFENAEIYVSREARGA